MLARMITLAPSLPAIPSSFLHCSDISATFSPGTMTAILGPSGAGKSTFLNIIAQRIRGHSGQILLNGKQPDTSFNQLVGYVQQDCPFLEHLTVSAMRKGGHLL